MQDKDIVIVGYARTPIGNFLGELKELQGHQLGTAAITAAIARSTLSPSDIDEVLMGCVLPAGQGQAPARQAAIHAGIPVTTPCTTLNKVCGSGMKAVMLAHDMLQVHSANMIVAGGMESMTNAPYLLTKARQGYRLGPHEIYDHMTLDGLSDAYEAHHPMGFFAEQCVERFKFSREQQDIYAMRSFELAKLATTDKLFAPEIIPITLKTKKGEIKIDKDEHPFSVDPMRIPTLPAVFVKNGTITAGNSSSIADGAAALVLTCREEAVKRQLIPIARIIGHAGTAKLPSDFMTAPIDATRKLLEIIDWQIKDVDIFEINEAFAVVVLAFMQELKIPRAKINIHGGSCALGHPLGATGARILVTLISAMQQRKAKRGIATLCIGGGEATAVAIELT